MKIFELTNIGKRLAKSVNAPNSESYSVIRFLDNVNTSTFEQIANYCFRGDVRQTTKILNGLKKSKPPVVREVSEI